ncbi:LamG-like jellyroll fold domain-containing protein [Micromonospora sp. B11E3]|uniref:LamG-like jellyroll fold domain-containing protein n=1 Tax=Micromonospora sp. B11E3 TaxID=3153562 RepID=UPI00325F9129
MLDRVGSSAPVDVCKRETRSAGGSGRFLLRERLAAATAALLLLPAVGVVVPALPAAAARAASPSCDEPAASEAHALASAAACNTPIAVESSRSEYTQVVAQPDGRLSFESTALPQRARQADGSWADVDLTLQTGTDGAIRPAVSVADVAFSGGGAGPLVTLRRAGKVLQLSWPGALPTPVLSGDGVTYPEVFSDVDLVLHATHTGFTHVLVVKSAEAAANPAIRKITFAVDGDVELTRQPDGSLQASAGSAVVARAEPARMWDSSIPADGGARAMESSTLVTGDGALTGEVVTNVTDSGDLELIPDPALLTSPEVTFPLFVDPAWSVAKSKWAYATSNGCTNTDYTMARVGYSPEGPCVGAKFRSYFMFPTTNGTISLSGKHIESAYVQMTLYHSYSCGDSPAHMYLTPVINATMKASWSGMTLKKWLDAADGHANKAGGCSDSPQADMTMNFTGSVVTGQVQTAATEKWSSITVGFCACNEEGQYESEQGRWKKFRPASAKLVVDYDSKPGKPNKLQTAGVDCPTGGMTIGTTTPTFSAIYPDGDSGQTLSGTYEWLEVPAAGMSSVTDTYPTRKTPPAAAPATANNRGTTATVTAANAKNYAFRVKTVDPAPYQIWSAWSDWCQFSIDTSVPPPPTITPPTFIPPDDGPGPGEPITFTISTTTTDVTKFRYSFTGPPATLYGMRAYPGDGTGGFSATYSEPASAWYTDGTVFSPGDLSGDGKPDVVFRRQETADLYIANGDGTGGFQGAAQLLDAGNWSTAQYLFSPGDFTGDGRPDLLYRDAATQNLWMRAGASGGGLQSTSVQIATGFSSANWIFSPGDFNGDGKPDVLWRKTDGSFYMIRGNGTGGWITGTSENIGAGWGGAALFGRGDFSGDGKTDVLVRLNGTGEVRLHRGNGTGGWLDTIGVTKGTIPPGGGVFSPGDFTGDGKPDILSAVAAPPSFGEVPAVTDPTDATKKTANVTVLAYKYGKNIFWARSIDATENLGSSNSKEVTIGKPSGPVAEWSLETYPEHDQTAALQDGQPLFGDTDGTGPLANDTPLTATNINWESDARLIGGTTAAMVGTGKQAQTSSPVVDTTKSFSVAAWVRVTDTGTTCCKTVVSQDGVVTNGFNLYYVPSTKQWGFSMYNADGTSTQGGFVFAAATANTWTHVSAVYDAAQKQMRLYVNGVLAGTTNHDSTWNASGAFHVGYAKWGSGQSNTGAGQIADVQVFNRVLVEHDFTGQLASDPDSGGVNEPGILAPTEVGRWEFEQAHPCYFADRADTCDAADNTPFARWLALSVGSDIGRGNRGNGLALDDSYFPDDGDTGQVTQEAARSATITGRTMDEDGNETTVWANTPVLRTDQSFTVSAWARVDRTDVTQTVVAQDGSSNSGFLLQYVPGAGSDPGTWKLSLPANSGATNPADTTSITAAAPEPDASWHHLVGVLDVQDRELRLYVDGTLATAVTMKTAWAPWQASGPLTVGRSIANGTPTGWLYGAVDDISVYQGALAPARVNALYHAQAVDPDQT